MSFNNDEEGKELLKSTIDGLELLRDEILKKEWKIALKRIDYLLDDLQEIKNV